MPFVFIQCLSKSLHLARLTFLMLSQGAGHFLKAYIGHVAHSSTGGSEVPAYDKCYIRATDIYCNAFCTGRHYVRCNYLNVRIPVGVQYLSDVYKSVNLMTVYSASLSFGEKNLDSKEGHLRLSALNKCIARI